jgi:hypothetical protein
MACACAAAEFEFEEAAAIASSHSSDTCSGLHSGSPSGGGALTVRACLMQNSDRIQK